MKTLTKDSISLYIFDDAETVIITDYNIAIGDPVKFIIADCSSKNTVLHERVMPPDDWIGGKYSFDGESWYLNSEWSEYLDSEPNNTI